MRKSKSGKSVEVYILTVHVGRKEGDGLPKAAKGAALLCYASGVSEDEAVRETVAVLKQADMAPLEVESLGARSEVFGDKAQADDAEAALMQRALDENAVIVAQVEVLSER